MESLKPHNSLVTQYLSKEMTNSMKGIFAICVLCHHLSQHSGIFAGTFLAIIFQHMGYLSVSMFFFFSGYGLMASYATKGRNYIMSMPRKRILPFYCICIILIAIYTIFKLLIGNGVTYSAVLRSFLFSQTIISNGWYLQTILLFYIGFYLIFLLNKKDSTKIAIMLLFAIGYCAVCIWTKLAITKYEAIFSFVLGLVWYKYKGEIDSRLSHKFPITLALLVAFCASFVLSTLDINEVVKTLSKMFSSVAFVAFALFVVIIIEKYNCILNNAITKKLGDISLEIYVLQGIFINLFHSKVLYIQNPYIYIVLVFICTIVLSLTLNPVFSGIYCLFQNKKNKVQNENNSLYKN